MKTAVVLGCEGQDGKILSEQLASQNYKVIGIDQGHEVNIGNIDSVTQFIAGTKPDEIYHLAAFHHSSEEAFTEDEEFYRKSFDVNYFSLLNFLESMRLHSPESKLFYAGSSHIFGSRVEEIQTEETPLNPDTVYAITKAAAMQTCHIYRQKYKSFASYGILFTHESPYRSEKFLSQKIIRAALDFKAKRRHEKLMIGDLSAVVDWGFAPEYMQAAQKILQLDSPQDFIIATGKKVRIEDFANAVFSELDLNWRDFVGENHQLLRRQSSPRIGSPEKLLKFTSFKPETYGPALAKVLLKSANK